MENLEIYNKVRSVPENAKKKIGAGRLSGYTDINPMWRIKILTEMFGPCGFGWKYEITRQWSEICDVTIQAHCNVNLYVKHKGEWSEAIPGTGGSQILAKESKGPYSDDEGYKKALTDALSVACKALGIGADVYWDKDTESKYSSKVAEVKPLTYEEALEYKIDGKTLKEWFTEKKQKEAFNKTDAQGQEAINTVTAGIKRLNAAKKKANEKSTSTSKT